jgi:ribosome-binding protein aMBF1 (putative translation factor)
MSIQDLVEQLKSEIDALQSQVQKSDKLRTLSPVVKVASLIRRERELQGLSRQELAEISGVSMTTLAKIESGSTDVRLESLLMAVRALGMDLWVA